MNTQIKTKAIRKQAVRNKEKDRIHRNILSWAKKIKAIQYKGGKCSCGQENPIVLSFHHNCGNKERDINDLRGRRARWEDIKKEIDKCVLICENCHRETHYKEIVDYRTERRRNNKQLCLNFIITKCRQCGYGKCSAALDFHHNDPANKEFGIAKRLTDNKAQSIYDLENKLISELEKCDVYCANCHKILHDKGFYEKYKKEIWEKAETLKEKIKVNAELIVSLRKQGLATKEIAAQCGYSYERVYEILRANGIQATRSIDAELIVKLKNEGLTVKEICKQASCSKDGVRYVMKHRLIHGTVEAGKEICSCENLAS